MTQVTEILRNDHTRLRKLLDTLELALAREETASPQTCEAVLETLGEELEAHIRREEVLLPFLYSMTRGYLRGYHEARAHADIRVTLHLLKDLLSGSHSVSVGAITAYGSHLIDTLKDHMNEEETFVFPVAEESLGRELLEDITRLIETGPETTPAIDIGGPL